MTIDVKATLLTLTALMVALSVAPERGLAQNIPAQGTGSVRGIVFDSLLMKPVPLARVVLTPGNRIVSANRNGEYRIDGVPMGQVTVSYTSPQLDSIGFGTIGATVNVIASRSTVADIATPSLRSLWSARCQPSGIVQRTLADSGIVWGSIGDARSDTLLDGAIARFQWMDLTPRRSRTFDIERIRSVVTTGSNGLYFACGVPTSQMIETVAETPDAASEVVSYSITEPRIRRIDFLVSTDMIVAVASRDTASPNVSGIDSVARGSVGQPRREYARGTATIEGVVTDASGRPVSGVTVNLASAEASTRTGADGRFRLSGMPGGTQSLEARRIGAMPVSMLVQVRPNRVTNVTVPMNTAVTLATMAIRSMSPARSEFEQRRLAGVGHVVGPEILEHRADLLSAFQNVPFVIPKRNGWSVQFNKPLTPFLDGRPTEMDLVTALPPDYFRAIEIIRLREQVPPQYMSNAGGGVILFWSKNVKW